ncbi:MAG TPA: twin-arginine translocation signal domain-containing protein [Burkholderiales bacterium]|nr:twin-arginine translocation signal domain-containing protein [Burkholderiales bacterium]
MPKKPVHDQPSPSRRKFLTTAAATTAAAAAVPMFAMAQDKKAAPAPAAPAPAPKPAAPAAPAVVSSTGAQSMRWQSTWPAKDIFHEYALDFAKKVNDMTGGDLRIEVLPAGAVVPAFGLLDAVSKGALDGGHGVLVYHYGKQNALALWGSGPGYGMDANMLLSWHKYGGGKELLNKLYQSVGANVVSFPYGPMPTQPLGWFKKPITKAEDFKGLKFRTVGISIDVFTGLGAAVNALPGGEIVPAMDRGLLDAAEFNNATSDRLLGFPDVSKVCMLQSYHQNAEQFEIMFNKTKYDALPAKMRAIIDNAVEAASADMSWKAVHRYSQDYIEMQQKQGVKFYKTPDSILQRQLTAYDSAVAKKVAENPLFKEIAESQKRFAERAVKWDLDTNVNRRMAYNHYFGGKKPADAKKT